MTIFHSFNYKRYQDNNGRFDTFTSLPRDDLQMHNSRSDPSLLQGSGSRYKPQKHMSLGTHVQPPPDMKTRSNRNVSGSEFTTSFCVLLVFIIKSIWPFDMKGILTYFQVADEFRFSVLAFIIFRLKHLQEIAQQIWSLRKGPRRKSLRQVNFSQSPHEVT